MKKVFVCLTLMLLTGCIMENAPLKGSYSTAPAEITVNKSIDIVWSNVIDLFATKGLSIKIIDKTNGLITSEKTSFINNYTRENDEGVLENSDAWIVVSKMKDGLGRPLSPDNLTGEWNIRVKSLDANRTSINVNLTNINGTIFVPASKYTAPNELVFVCKSTGRFEKTIFDLISK